MIMKIITGVVFFFLITAMCIAENTEFANISTAQGLVHKTVNCIARDKDGFLWVGTTCGISRYDGYTFKNFIPDEYNSGSLHGANVWGIAEGADGRLWFATNAGIERFDKKTERFELVKLPWTNEETSIKSFCADEQGQLWVNNSSGSFVKIIPAATSYSIKKIDLPREAYSGGDSSVYKLVASDGVLWIARKSGILKFDYRRGRVQHVLKETMSYCHFMKKVNDSIVTMSYLSQGIFVLNTHTGRATLLEHEMFAGKAKENLALYNATFAGDGTLWVGATPGLFSLKDNYVEYYSRFDKQNYFEGGVVSCTYTDADDNLWIGTYDFGLYCLVNKRTAFKVIPRLSASDVYNTTVAGLVVFDDLSLLYCDSKGFYVCDNIYQLDERSTAKLSDGFFPAVFPKTGRSCLLKISNNFHTFDATTRRIGQPFLRQPVFCSSAFTDTRAVLWTGMWDGCLFGYDAHGNQKYAFTASFLHTQNSTIYSICGDGSGGLWLGTMGAGLVHVKNPTGQSPRVDVYTHNKVSNSLSMNNILCLLNDETGNLWVGTCGGGLNRLNTSTGEFTVFTVKNGLRSNIIESILKDNDGNIWFGSSVLTKYDVRRKTFSHYTSSDGIAGGFMLNSCGVSPRGDLLFGTTRGLLMFHPRDVVDSISVPAPRFTALRLRGLPVSVGDTIDDQVPCPLSITYLQELRLPFSLNSFAIEFASINYQMNHTFTYEYKLEGVDCQWVSSDSRSRQASYSGLQPGSYVFEVRALSGSGKYSPASRIEVIIVPPWWKTWWFSLLFSALLAMVIGSLLWYRYRLLKRQNLLLEQTVKTRTGELLQANEQLLGQNEQLREHQIVIEMRNAELNETLHTKDELIKVISHDFKNPLSGIIGIAGLMTNDENIANSHKNKSFADLILKSARTLYDQMMTVLDWAQSLNHNLVAAPVEMNIEVLIDDAITLYKENARQKNIAIIKQSEFETTAFIDPRMISVVFRNLLSNAIKFSHPNSSIYIITNELETSIDIEFIDSGVGIDKQKIESMFQKTASLTRSYGTANEKGTGVGLVTCKFFVEKNAGQLGISSQEGKGSVFAVSLPKGQSSVTRVQTKVAAESNGEIAVATRPATILVIDDDVEIRELVHTMFDDSFTIIKAENGNEGLYIAQNTLPDLVLCDINLPAKNGYEVCEMLKKNEITSHIPLLLISSLVDTHTAAKALASGANDFIEKPLVAQALRQKVVALLDYRNKIKQHVEKNIQKEQEALRPLDFESKTIKKIILLIEENLDKADLNTEFIAERMGISRSQLWRIFKSTTGKTLGDFIREVRMKKAAEFIKTGKYRISEVADLVGYADPRNFSKCFSKEFGMIPSDYLNSVKK